MSNTRNTQESQGSQKSQDSQNSSKSNDKQTARKRPSPMDVLRQARGQLAELTGMEAESVSSFEQTDEGWALEVEVLELERVPDTMSLMASYQVELDADGQLTGYRRVRRYERGRSDARRPGGR
ncbi:MULTISPECIES: gas vesicle protein [Streptomyces]|uniref:Gas vesicle protein n=1 Tax=Streptomyces koelreuteriae TaxID=2838015 RepID=A0ABX8FLM8_9ACTN|nr:MULTISPECIES: gas vesicle protein [Streptomyces]QWB22058.1 gas vesicle protein [Streptomyces koelreuteriae]UUA04991.1 gas vesicle protein [Streptomyces koelreuteriae]UUA12615.1 gas vesicle protein [Streptomyces sp. CRCS-T-1]